MEAIARHVTYANVVATLALILALSGTAMAAKHYLITSTRQIQPSVLKQLRGATGPRGPSGPGGPEGPAGAPGPAGNQGPAGANAAETAELATLRAMLPYIKFVPSGIGGKPTIQFSGVNVQVVSGAGKTAGAVNGTGNLVIGYDEFPGTQTGSHSLVIGDELSFTSYAGLIAGESNSITAPYASVLGGYGNVANGPYSNISGGIFNTTSGREASIGGGEGNSASGIASSVGGGTTNHAVGRFSSVSGGSENKAEGDTAGPAAARPTSHPAWVRRSAAEA